MEDPHKEDRWIQEFRPPERNTGRLCQIWHSGLNLGKKIALTGIIASAAPLALPPLVVISAFGVAFSVPFGFYYASYALTDKLMSTLLSNPNPPPSLLQYDVFGDDAEQKFCQYVDGRVEVEDSEEFYDLEEEQKVLEDDVSQALKVRIELEEEEDNEVRDIGIEEDIKYIREVMVNKFEKDGYEEDTDEYIKKEEAISSTAAEIVNDTIGNGVEGLFSADVGWENDNYVEQVEETDIFGPGVSMEDRSKHMVEFGVVQPEDLETEMAGMIESVRDEGKSVIRSPSVASEILKGIQEAEEEISLMEELGGHMLGNNVEAVVMSVEVGGENDIDVSLVQEVDVFMSPRVITEENMPEVMFGDVEAEEFEREMTELVESIEDECVSETKNLEKSVLSEVCREDDSGVEQVDVCGPQVSMEGSRPMVKFGDVELEELERETSGRVESIGDELLGETKNDKQTVGNEEPIPSIASEILKGIQEAEDEISLKEGRGELTGNEIEVVASADINGEQVHEVGVFGPRVNMEDNRSKVKFGDVEPDELERETTGMIESIRDEGITETKNHENAVEKAPPFMPDDSGPLEGNFGNVEPREKISPDLCEGEFGTGDNLKQLKLPSEKESEFTEDTRRDDESVSTKEEIDLTMLVIPEEGEQVRHSGVRDVTGDYKDLEGVKSAKQTEGTIGEEGETIADDNLKQLKLPSEKESELPESVSIQDTRRDDKLVLTKEEIDNTMFVIPEEGEQVRHSGEVRDVTGDYKDLGGIRSEKQTERTTGEEGETIADDKDPVHVKKLVVHFKKTSNIKATSIREETVICVRADTSGLDMLDQDHYHPEGKDLNSDHEIPPLSAASASTSIEGFNNEGHIWKQINAMRTIVGYEAEPNASYVEELKALYIFTGVEPPASFMEPTSMADVNEKLQFLMAIVGVM